VNRNKILYDLTSATNRISGIERYAVEVLRCILASEKFDKFIVVVSKDYAWVDELKKSKVTYYHSFTNSRIFNEWIYLPLVWLLNIRSARAIFLPAFPPSLFFKLSSLRLFRTVHDVVLWEYPETISWKSRYYTKILESSFINRYDKIFTVSNDSVKRINKFFPKTIGKTFNTYNGLSKSIKSSGDRDLISRFIPSETKYLLSVGTLEPRKNFPFLLEVFSLIKSKIETDDLKLVLVGRKGWGWSAIEKKIIKLNLKDSVIITDAVDDNELASFYEYCELFIYTSTYEGFGLPVVEALVHKKLVISSDSGSLAEVIGESGVILSLDDSVDKWAEVVISHLSQPALRKVYLGRIQMNLSRFQWPVVSSEILFEILSDE
jgi:glycosyltransferase involved in cell wall biosynthesis